MLIQSIGAAVSAARRRAPRAPFLSLLLLPVATAAVAQGGVDDVNAKAEVIRYLESNHEPYASAALRIWELAEVGYQEVESSAILQALLWDAGFEVQAGVAGMPTGFIASYGSGRPVVAILAEFDALPGITQAAVPQRRALPHMHAGHACGHHLFGAGSTAAAVAVKRWLADSGRSGTVRVYGTPAEEGGAGKVYMVREGLFEDVDVVLHWHPADRNGASPATSLANKSAKFRFHGISSHAAAAPERGRSALDGVEAMNYMVNMMREHVPQETRIHYVITRGGSAPNVVPDFAEVYYYVRHPDPSVLEGIVERVIQASEGAATGTGTRVEHEIIHGIYSLLPNETLQRVMYENLLAIGGVSYNEEERGFARAIQETLGPDAPALEVAAEIQPFELQAGGGSTDVGDVSWVVPTAGARTATWVPGTAAHSWQAVAAGGTSIGEKGMAVAAKVLATTAVDIFLDPALAASARQELERRRGARFAYSPLLGDRPPPLDYRN